ncbi:hypothetical protein [Proteus terrae]|uniref:hypothetical protein n=1 Tax=Proteus terrae TaxID=1574161 RepID=UPI0035234367
MFISAPKFKIRGNRLPLPLIILTTPINELINYLKEQKQIDSFIIKNKCVVLNAYFVILCTGAWINLVQAFCQRQKEKSPGKYIHINRGGLKNRQFDSASIFIGVQEEMKKYSLIGLMIVTMILPSNVLLERKYLIYAYQTMDI